MSIVMKEQKVFINGAVSIGATVSYADNSKVSPAIILISGTGKTDRDGNARRFTTNLYKNFAELFVSCGFVCIRYDKRGTHQSEGNFNTAGLHDLVDDAVSVVQYAKTLPYVDETKIIVCGHSEGAMIATLLSERESTAGLLLLGGAATNLKDALIYQNLSVVQEFQEKKGLIGLLLRPLMTQKKAMAKLEALFQKCSATTKDRVFFGGVMMNAKWIRDHASHSTEEYIELLRQYKKPIFAISGTADLSVDYKSLANLTDLPFVEVFTPDGINHILREIDDNNSFMKVKKQYLRLSKKPIHEATQQKIKEWLCQFTV